MTENTALLKRIIDHSAWHVAPFVDILRADDNDVEGDFEASKLTTQTGRLGTTFRDVAGLYDKQVEIAVGARFATGARAEEDHPCPRVRIG
jgi:hypothetical protein